MSFLPDACLDMFTVQYNTLHNTYNTYYIASLILVSQDLEVEESLFCPKDCLMKGGGRAALDGNPIGVSGKDPALLSGSFSVESRIQVSQCQIKF